MKVTPNGFDRKKISWLLEQDLEVKLTALGHYWEISRMLMNDILEDEVKIHTGERYSHDKPHNGRYSRWGTNPGSVKLGDQRIRLLVPRIYDNELNCSKSLGSYGKLRQANASDERLFKALLLGLSTRDYEQVVGNMLDSFGLSASSVSKDFVEQSQKKLEDFDNRSLAEYEFVAIYIDGKYLAKEQIIIALGITITGRKIPLGFIQSGSENSRVIKELLSNLVDRGLQYNEGLLVVIDGSKGIYKAVKEVFDNHAIIQRCQWHKRENVLSYLPESKQDHYKKRINKAYNQDHYEYARSDLKSIVKDLKTENMSASRSLEEGLEETLTLHRLGLTDHFKRSFSTTNIIESLNSQVERYLKKVKYWQNSSQRHRWTACALMEIEQRMRRVHNYKKLYLLKEKLLVELEKNKTKVKGAA
jgi:transposase-like protein